MFNQMRSIQEIVGLDLAEHNIALNESVMILGGLKKGDVSGPYQRLKRIASAPVLDTVALH